MIDTARRKELLTAIEGTKRRADEAATRLFERYIHVANVSNVIAAIAATIQHDDEREPSHESLVLDEAWRDLDAQRAKLDQHDASLDGLGSDWVVF